jgi:prepilin-type N-terminal cleavage/methylation domain-containing protein
MAESMKSTKSLASRQTGFTMIEMLVSITVLSVVMIGMFSFLWGASTYWRNGEDSADLTENARQGLNRMTRELNQASVVTVAGTAQVSFSVDFGDGQQTIAYGYGDGTEGSGLIWRSVNGGEQLTLINNVGSVSFDYYGNDYRCDSDNDSQVTYSELALCQTDPLSHIARVDVNLDMRSGSNPTQSFVAQSWLRNRSTT